MTALATLEPQRAGASCLVVGCGLGEDAARET
jgi:hypothetical protein